MDHVMAVVFQSFRYVQDFLTNEWGDVAALVRSAVRFAVNKDQILRLASSGRIGGVEYICSTMRDIDGFMRLRREAHVLTAGDTAGSAETWKLEQQDMSAMKEGMVCLQSAFDGIVQALGATTMLAGGILDATKVAYVAFYFGVPEDAVQCKSLTVMFYADRQMLTC